MSSQYEDAKERPWKKEEFPYLALWLEKRKELVEKLVDISKTRTGYYHPLTKKDESGRTTITIQLPQVQSVLSTGRLFEIQGNLDFTNGKFDHAFECAFSSLRIGKTMQNGGTCLVEELIGIALTRMGDRQLTVYLADLAQKKDAAWILQKKKEFDAIALQEEPAPAPPNWCTSERMCALSVIQQLAVDTNFREKTLVELFELKDEWLKKYGDVFAADKNLDWNEMMRQINRWYDDVEDIFSPPSLFRQRNAIDRLDKRLIRFTKENETDTAAKVVLMMLMPGVQVYHNAFDRNLWERRTTSIAFSLAAYRADHNGKNPDTLNELIPKYIESIPVSPSTGKPMRYVKRLNDALIANNDRFKLDGSEADVEKAIAETPSGKRAAIHSSTDYIFVVQKN
ncbi:hypothetical protein FACS189419_04420 [Planctomycetales bacterium]|nr:hypothetical protein FACS189419_04420 [Planctomycetales bacterium]